MSLRRIPRVLIRQSAPIHDQNDHRDGLPKPPPKPRTDAVKVFLRWKAALDAGHRSQATAALAELQELAQRPVRELTPGE